MWDVIDTLVAATGAAVLHFLWQGVLIGLVAAIVLRLLRDASAVTRYGVSVVLLCVCATTFIGTLALGLRAVGGLAIGAFFIDLDPSAAEFATGASSAWSFGPLIDGAGWFWAAGVIYFAVRSFGHWIGARRLRTRGTSLPDAYWSSEFASMRASFGVRRSVRLLCSGRAEAPMVVGWLAPVVLVPAGAFTSLTPDQLRAVLAHELAHIRRLDHLVNAGQVVIETVLFFHPVIWLLSKRIRIEREHCCDDAAVRASGSPLVFAGALAALESLRTVHPHAALAANGGSLMERISRILGAAPRPAARGGLRSVASLLSIGVVIAGAGLVSAAGVKDGAKSDPVVEALRDAVASEVMTAEEARQAYDALATMDVEIRRAIDEKLAAHEARVRAAVEAGKLAPEDAAEKIAAMEREMARHTEMTFAMDVLGLTKGEAYLATVREDIAKKLRAGDLTEAEAAAWMEKAEASVNLREEYAAHVAAAEAKIRAAIEAGEMTPEEGRLKMAELKEGVGMRMRFHAAAERIKAAIARGEMTPEEGEAKLAELKREMSAKRGAKRDIDWDAIKRRIDAAVERGDMTREEGEAKLVELRREMASKRDGAREAEARREIDWDSIKRRIEGAVERGDMTREEADAAYKRLKEGARSGR